MLITGLQHVKLNVMKLILFGMFYLLGTVSVAQSTFENKNWTDHRITKQKALNQVVIYSNGKGKAKNYSRKIVVAIKNDLVKGECQLKIEKVSYFDKKTSVPILVDVQNPELNDAINLLGVFNNLVKGTGLDGSAKNPVIKVDCETLHNYYDALPEKLPELSVAAQKPFKRGFIMLNITPMGTAWNTNTVDTSYFSNTCAVTKREQSEKRITGLRSWGLSAGVRLRRRHIAYFEIQKTYMGFDSRYSFVDWLTGLPIEYDIPVKYRFNSWTVGTGYSYTSSAESSFNIIASFGVHYSFKTSYDATRLDNGVSIKTATDDYTLEKKRMGGKLGLGLLIGKQNSWFTLNILPVYQWDWTPVNRGQLSTRLHMWGLNLGAAFNFVSR